MVDSFDDIIRTLREIGSEDFSAKIAKKTAKNLEVSLTKTLSAGQDPEGKAWTPREKGGRAYAHAASKLAVRSHGNLVRATVTGPEVYGHYGVRGMPVRQMVPDAGGGIPKSVSDAVLKAAQDVLKETVRA